MFFTNSGSESVDTALKIAFQYQRLKGEATRTRLIGRERGYHGVNLGGTSLGGMVGNRKALGPGDDPGRGSPAAYPQPGEERIHPRASRSMARELANALEGTGRAA